MIQCLPGKHDTDDGLVLLIQHLTDYYIIVRSRVLQLSGTEPGHRTLSDSRCVVRFDLILPVDYFTNHTTNL